MLAAALDGRGKGVLSETTHRGGGGGSKPGCGDLSAIAIAVDKNVVVKLGVGGGAKVVIWKRSRPKRAELAASRSHPLLFGMLD